MEISVADERGTDWNVVDLTVPEHCPFVRVVYFMENISIYKFLF
jgi:hypothetical protein